MPNSPQASLENNFTGGLKTEYTGLNFPENACTSASNCVFSIIGDVSRREGFDFETNFQLNSLVSPTNVAISTYKWDNVGGDGSTQIVVQQVGGTLYFYLSSSATSSNPLSKQILASTVDISSFLATNAITSFDATQECTYTDGNGYLFVFNGQCDPFFVSYNPSGNVLTATRITIQIRDLVGIPEPGVAFNFRPPTLTNEHAYNLFNQGWGSAWSAIGGGANTIGPGNFTFTLVPGPPLPIVVGAIVVAVAIGATSNTITGTVVSYNGNVLVIAETATTGSGTFSAWTISPSATSYAATFFKSAKSGGGDAGTAQLLNLYPSNAEQWWWYRDTNVTNASPDGTFKPSRTTDYVVLNNQQAPQGSVILPAFIQDRTATLGIPGLTPVTTTARPTNGCWYAGRLWATGVNASQQPTGDAPFTTWTETIYFSQVIVNSQNFGQCYQENDPTSSTEFNLLSTDGGTIVIPGSGAIYKLFRVQNGVIAFCANGIWFITGGAAVGFTADNYSVNKISGVKSISSFSYVDVLGWPLFWNEDGIYQVKPSQENVPYGHGGFQVENLALGTILSFYGQIPLQSKKYARGAYDPLSYTVQWLYRNTNETDITSRYTFDSILNINTYKGPFYPYSFTVSPTTPYVSSIQYVSGPGGSNTPASQLEYLTVYQNKFTFSQERDNTNWLDWNTTVPTDYLSTFTTGYKLHGQAWKLWWLGYIWVYSNNNNWPQTAYTIRGVWNYGSSGNSGKWTAVQKVINNIPNFGYVARKIRIRGVGLALQLQFNSVTGYPFNFAGWSMFEQINQGV